jgi:hypothetical protein
MCSVGSGMVLAIGELAGAAFVTLLAATFARAGRLWEIEVAARLGWSGMAPRHRPLRGSIGAIDPSVAASVRRFSECLSTRTRWFGRACAIRTEDEEP